MSRLIMNKDRTTCFFEEDNSIKYKSIKPKTIMLQLNVVCYETNTVEVYVDNTIATIIDANYSNIIVLR